MMPVAMVKTFWLLPKDSMAMAVTSAVTSEFSSVCAISTSDSKRSVRSSSQSVTCARVLPRLARCLTR